MATIFLVLVMLFFIFNVYTFTQDRNADYQDTISQLQQVDSDRSAEQVTISNPAFLVNGDEVAASCTVINTCPLSVEIVRLWVQDMTTQAISNLDVSIVLSPGRNEVFSRIVSIAGAAQSHSFNLWFVTARGNVLSPYPSIAMIQDDARETGSIKMDWMQFRYYDFGSTNKPVDYTPLPEPQLGCSIPRDHYVMVSAVFTNMDPDGRTITLTPDSYVWAIDPREGTSGALKTLLTWNIAEVENGQYRSSFTSQSLYFNVPTVVYFCSPSSKTPDNVNPVPLSINMYGLTDTGSYGQNIPFVSIKFTDVTY